MNQCHILPNTLTIYIVTLAALIQPLENANDFILLFEMVLKGHIILNQ